MASLTDEEARKRGCRVLAQIHDIAQECLTERKGGPWGALSQIKLMAFEGAVEMMSEAWVVSSEYEEETG